MTCRGEGLHRYVRTGEAEIPAIRLSADGDGLGRAFQRAAPTNSNPPDLQENQEAVVQRRANAELLVGEGMPAVAALIAWKARFLSCLHSAKERLVGFVESRQYVLQDM